LDDGNQTLYVWLVDDEPRVGALGDYAESWEHSRHLDIPISTVVWTFEDTKAIAHRVEVKYHGTHGSHYMNYTLSIDGYTICAAIDGRA
jgi:hypothetical protein